MSLPEGEKLEIGGWYKRRDGVVVGPLESRGPTNPYPFRVYRCDYHVNIGVYNAQGSESCEDPKFDLVERVPSPTISEGELAAQRKSWARSCVTDSPRGALPVDSQARKDTPVYSGFLKYFPRAAAYIAQVSKAGNDKHNPGQPLHWSKGKSNDHADCVARHLLEHGTIDPEDNLRHSGKLAWRALALLETELENDAEATTRA